MGKIMSRGFCIAFCLLALLLSIFCLKLIEATDFKSEARPVKQTTQHVEKNRLVPAANPAEAVAFWQATSMNQAKPFWGLDRWIFLLLMVGGPLISGTVLILMLFWSRRLKREVWLRTEALEKELIERKQIEQKLRKSEEQFSLAMDVSKDGIWDRNVLTDEIYFNRRYFSILGFKSGELPSDMKSWSELIHEDDRDAVLDWNERCIMNECDEFEIEFRMQTKNNGWRWILGRGKAVARDEAGKASRMVGTHTDITERKKSEEALKISEELYRGIVEDTPVPINRFLPDNKIFFVNKAYCDYFGKRFDELVGHSFLSYIPDPDRARVVDAIAALNKTNPVLSHEHKVVLPNGKTSWMQWTNRAIFNLNDEIVGYQSIGEDITDRKNAEEKIQIAYREMESTVEKRTADYKKAKEEAERANKLKSEFLSNMSHELRTPMQGIIGYSKLALSNSKKIKKSKLIDYFAEIHSNGRRLLGLLNDLLDLSKLESGRTDYRISNENLSHLVSIAVNELQILAHEKNISVDYKKPEFDYAIEIDPEKILQVIRNLLTNSIKYSDLGGRINVQLVEDKTDLKLSIRDQGIGIPEDELDIIFEKFVQSRLTKSGAGGTGLGLSICKQIIKDHQGKIWVENNPESGTTFHFTLPVKK